MTKGIKFPAREGDEIDKPNKASEYLIIITIFLVAIAVIAIIIHFLILPMFKPSFELEPFDYSKHLRGYKVYNNSYCNISVLYDYQEEPHEQNYTLELEYFFKGSKGLTKAVHPMVWFDDEKNTTLFEVKTEKIHSNLLYRYECYGEHVGWE